MADIRISELPEANDFDGAELIPVIQAGASKQHTLNALLSFIIGKTSFSANVGDGVAVNYGINHNLNTRNVSVSVRRATTPWDQVMVDNEASGLNQVILKFGAIPPTTNQFIVTIKK